MVAPGPALPLEGRPAVTPVGPAPPGLLDAVGPELGATPALADVERPDAVEEPRENPHPANRIAVLVATKVTSTK